MKTDSLGSDLPSRDGNLEDTPEPHQAETSFWLMVASVNPQVVLNWLSVAAHALKISWRLGGYSWYIL